MIEKDIELIKDLNALLCKTSMDFLEKNIPKGYRVTRVLDIAINAIMSCLLNVSADISDFDKETIEFNEEIINFMKNHSRKRKNHHENITIQ